MNRKKRGLLSRITACALAFSMAFAGSGCGSSQKTETIYVIGQSQGIQFWDLVQKGAEDAGSELGYNIVYENATNTNDIDTQKKLIQQAISEKAKAIVFAPNDPSALNDDLSAAQNAGIKLIAIDAPTSFKGVSYVGTDNLSAGNIAGRNANNSILFGKGKVAIIKHSQASSAASDRVNGFKQALKASEGSDGIQFVFEVSCEGDTASAKQQAIKAIKDNPDLKLIYTTNEKSTIGACDAVSELDLSGKVRVIGYNSNDTEISFLMDQTLTGTIIQSPYNMGYLGVKYATDLLDTVTVNGVSSSKTIPSNIDTGATYISLNNYSDDISQLLIHPDEFGQNQNGVAK